MGTASSIANSAPASTASGNGSPVCSATSPVTYADPPQNAACPKDSSPVYPSRMSRATANRPHARMSRASGG